MRRAPQPPTATRQRRDEREAFVRSRFDEVPRIPLFQPTLSVAMQKNMSGYRYWFHRQLDYRTLAKA